MRHLEWDDRYIINVDFIDREHQTLFATMNKLLRIIESEEKSEWACREGVKYLKNHAVEHFEHEEKYMQSIQHEEYEIHKRLHDDFRYHTLPSLEAELEETQYSEEAVKHFLGVCIGWVIAHTKTEDQRIAAKSPAGRTVKLLPGKEIEALETVIMQLTREVVGFNAKLISEQYAGENFGKMICCRFCYRGGQKNKWEVTLIMEERFVLSVVGKILNVEYPRVDDMVINVIRYVARQFLEQVRESFPAIDLLTLEKESLLTHEQIVKSYERDEKLCSLLFDTGKGYFAFYATSSGTVNGKLSPAIDAQHAMGIIHNYLDREKEEQAREKRKILVVDDSDFLRASMSKLLSGDYEVIEASSSISAIKKIALNRPDLVLLDYEMPICDGKQALEMIRSETDMADTPVFFLTGRGDRESVKKVVALKPEGYLLKTMPEKEIKASIDDFFEKRSKVQ
ncbi:MAG: response regulator [Butyrivibrio sp.]|nr:response regulator [Acetatifactor muris]MCM1559270.1 response regulator [Butyrivibrio sp.]